MKRLNKLASVFCVAAMALTAMTGCEGSDMFSVNSPDWLSEKIDSIEKANQSTEEVLVGMNEDVYTVGNTDFSSAFFTSFSKYYVVQDNQKWNAVFNLNINPSATNTYNNFVLIITNDVLYRLSHSSEPNVLYYSKELPVCQALFRIFLIFSDFL